MPVVHPQDRGYPPCWEVHGDGVVHHPAFLDRPWWDEVAEDWPKPHTCPEVGLRIPRVVDGQTRSQVRHQHCVGGPHHTDLVVVASYFPKTVEASTLRTSKIFHRNLQFGVASQVHMEWGFLERLSEANYGGKSLVDRWN
jgi:hypothetical protein